jgi:hypothetical protein
MVNNQLVTNHRSRHTLDDMYDNNCYVGGGTVRTAYVITHIKSYHIERMHPLMNIHGCPLLVSRC